MVKGVCFEIVVHGSKSTERYLIDIEPEDVHFVKDVTDPMETFEQRLDRIENLQGIYVELWDKTTEKIEQCKKQLKNTDYKIVLVKRKSDHHSKAIKFCDPDGEPEKECDRYSTASTVVIGDRKSSSGSDTSDLESPIKRKCKVEFPKISSCSKYMIIGPNGTQINRNDYEGLNWKDPGSPTRKLLTLVFGEEVLATHSLTGNQSPAFRGRERAPKSKLDPSKTSDIIYIVTLKCKVKPQIVRAAITTKCADTSKKFRRLSMKV
ncbi:early boundary activity protein 2 [Episyrphus balteatus]|uniref:early boundary activity protein 2 n=1 Tax=Episyrphus balteatus TaxID=286459 RepID=UPI0024867C37|nr:early boundary activity protein 2 [Episyrphus balteatus]